jgi:hypothetical protein
MAQPDRELLPLEERAAAQGGVVTRAQLHADLGSAALRRSLRAGVWQPVHRGTYTPRSAARTDPWQEHLLQCAARVVLAKRDLVVSHSSAALLHRMRLLDGYDGPPQLTLVRPPGAPPQHERLPLASTVPRAHRQLLSGVPITTRPRTVADLARTLHREAALVMTDAALAAGVDRLDVLAVLDDCRGWPGAAEAVDVLIFANRRAESPLESLAREWFSRAGLPAPQLQTRLCDAGDGRFVARVDFFWPQHRTVCEVDGRVKYDQPDALWHEKLREDSLRDLGLELARGYWSDRPQHGQALVERVQRAFARGARRRDAPSYGVLTSR